MRTYLAMHSLFSILAVQLSSRETVHLPSIPWLFGRISECIDEVVNFGKQIPARKKSIHIVGWTS
jgi:hypothetical protein